MKLTFAQLDHAQKLASALIEKSDINRDGTIRDGDLAKLRAAGQKDKDVLELAAALDPLRKYAQKHGGPSKANVKKALAEAVKKLKARDKDGSGALEDKEQVKSMTVMESQLLRFAQATKSKKVSDFKLPKTYDGRPKFNPSGTAAQVATSLLDSHSKSTNDNLWPGWASNPEMGRAARFVLDGTEARAMVATLKKLYPSRQRAIVRELATRSQATAYGCVSPTDAGKKVLDHFASQLGLNVTFGQPGAPALHVS